MARAWEKITEPLRSKTSEDSSLDDDDKSDDDDDDEDEGEDEDEDESDSIGSNGGRDLHAVSGSNGDLELPVQERWLSLDPANAQEARETVENADAFCSEHLSKPSMVDDILDVGDKYVDCGNDPWQVTWA